VISMGALQRPEGAADRAMAYREAGRIAAAFELGICHPAKRHFYRA
jgi:hypothetical protein